MFHHSKSAEYNAALSLTSLLLFSFFKRQSELFSNTISQQEKSYFEAAVWNYLQSLKFQTADVLFIQMCFE